MISLDVMLFIFMLLFAVIGAMRGWSKELLVAFSIVLALFTLFVLESFVPFFEEFMASSTPKAIFLVRTAILAGLAFFGYQTPRFPKFAESERFMRNHLQDALLGIVFGALNGFLIFGSIWFFLHSSGYPLSYVQPPLADTDAGEAALGWIKFLPPNWLMTSPAVYFAVVICFILVIVVFI